MGVETTLFPARAGVIPIPTARRLTLCPLPRASGGNSTLLSHSNRVRALFPARAGVIPKFHSRPAIITTLPRASGGNSGGGLAGISQIISSPRERG